MLSFFLISASGFEQLLCIYPTTTFYTDKSLWVYDHACILLCSSKDLIPWQQLQSCKTGQVERNIFMLDRCIVEKGTPAVQIGAWQWHLLSLKIIFTLLYFYVVFNKWRMCLYNTCQTQANESGTFAPARKIIKTSSKPGQKKFKYKRLRLS